METAEITHNRLDAVAEKLSLERANVRPLLFSTGLLFFSSTSFLRTVLPLRINCDPVDHEETTLAGKEFADHHAAAQGMVDPIEARTELGNSQQQTAHGLL
jgi:hypothetical protein